MKRFILFASFLALATQIYGCGDDCRGGSRSCGDDDDDDDATDATIPERCTMSSQCNDAVECTTDSCSPAGTCRFDLVNESCPSGELCTASGCASPPECTEDAMCDDNKECTSDRCTIEGCVNDRVDARCATAGFGSVCNPDGAGANATTGCTPATGCANAAQCDDETTCTIDTCVDNRCVNMPNADACEDDEACVPGSSGTGCMEIRPCDSTSPDADEMCDDHQLCNGTEVCVAEFGCMNNGGVPSCVDSGGGSECTPNGMCDPALNEGTGGCDFTCSEAISGCDCDGPSMCDPSFTGRFTISPAPAQSCNDVGGGPEVDYNLSSVEFICSSGMLSILAALPKTSSEATLTQMTMPSGTAFDAKFVVAGSCAETYRLQGTFTDADHFSGTFSFTFPDSCDLCGLVDGLCCMQTVSVTGVRAD